MFRIRSRSGSLTFSACLPGYGFRRGSGSDLVPDPQWWLQINYQTISRSVDCPFKAKVLNTKAILFSGYGIKCWVCRSDGDPKCADPFDNTSFPITDCRYLHLQSLLLSYPTVLLLKNKQIEKSSDGSNCIGDSQILYTKCFFSLRPEKFLCFFL